MCPSVLAHFRREKLSGDATLQSVNYSSGFEKLASRSPTAAGQVFLSPFKDFLPQRDPQWPLFSVSSSCLFCFPFSFLLEWDAVTEPSIHLQSREKKGPQSIHPSAAQCMTVTLHLLISIQGQNAQAFLTFGDVLSYSTNESHLTHHVYNSITHSEQQALTPTDIKPPTHHCMLWCLSPEYVLLRKNITYDNMPLH